MSIRISLYDFFAYTIPGIFYLIIAAFLFYALGLIEIDLNTFSNLSIPYIFIIVGAGYISGLLMDAFSYNWMRLFYCRNREIVKITYNNFLTDHPWVVFDLTPLTGESL